MRPSKEDKYHNWHKKPDQQTPAEPSIKVRFYTLIFNDKPEVRHRISISKKDDLYSYEIRFSKPLVHPITKTSKTKDNLSCNNLNELKQLLRSYLKVFGDYQITPE